MWPFRKKEVILTNRKFRDYLPLGTIVKINNDDNEYVIFRYLGNSCRSFNYNSKSLKKSHIYNINKEKGRKYYHVDYQIELVSFSEYGIPLYIMHDDIKEIVHMGYDDEYRRNILTDIDNWNENKGGF